MGSNESPQGSRAGLWSKAFRHGPRPWKLPRDCDRIPRISLDSNESHQGGCAGPWSEAFNLVLGPPPGGFPEIVKASQDSNESHQGRISSWAPPLSWRLPRDCDRIPRFRWIPTNLTWGAVQAYGRKLTCLWSKALFSSRELPWEGPERESP